MGHPTRTTTLGTAGAIWGVGGIVGVLTMSVIRLTPVALEALRSPLSFIEWTAALLCMVMMAYSEGYKGFQKAFSPRVVARAKFIAHHPSFIRVAFAPIFCMSLFGATKVRTIVSWTIMCGVVVLVILVKGLGQPWRGIVDAGVVVGLTWGTLAIVGFAISAIRGKPPGIDPDIAPSILAQTSNGSQAET